MTYKRQSITVHLHLSLSFLSFLYQVYYSTYPSSSPYPFLLPFTLPYPHPLQYSSSFTLRP